MSSDRSRRTDRARHGYTGIAAQQGRVILDRDVNALQGLIADRREAESIDVIGPSGTPDDGFRITLPGEGGSPPQFFSPPFSPPPSSPPITIGGPGDLLISPGTMYLGGQRVVFPAHQNGVPIEYSYFDQPDWPFPDVPNGQSSQELVYLDVTEQEVSAVEDPDLLDVALGGPDTTQRLKLLRRVRRLPVSAGDCMTAWQQAIAQFAAQGLRFDPATMRLIPQASLQIGFTTAERSGDPCDPVATGGYLGSDNQLIRVRTVNAGGNTSLIWGYDNASFLYRITSVSADRTMLTLASDPPDGFHVPQTGQLVEILTTAAVLGQEPDETDPAATATILRVSAEAEGFLSTLAQPYGPVTPGDPTQYIVLGNPLPFGVANSPLPLLLRVWQAQLDLPSSGGLVELTDPTTRISTGLTATITVPAQSSLPDGAFWQLAVRPATPQGVYPEELLTAPQPPDGPRRWVCPLAVISSQEVLEDCRKPFAPITCGIPVVKVLAKDGYDHDIFLRNGMELQADNLSKGLRLVLNQTLDPATVDGNEAACFVTLQLPYPLIPLNPVDQNIWGTSIIGYQPLVLPADVKANSQNSLFWKPFDDISLFFQGGDRLEAMRRRRAPTQFQKDWQIFDPPATPPQGEQTILSSHWDYQEDSVIQSTLAGHTPGGEGFPGLTTNGIATYRLTENAYYIGMTATPNFTAESLPFLGSSNAFQYQNVGLVFNWFSDNDYYLFRFTWTSKITFPPEGGSLQNYASSVEIYRVLNKKMIFITERTDRGSGGFNLGFGNAVLPTVLSLNIKLTRNRLLFRAIANYSNPIAAFDQTFSIEPPPGLQFPQTLLSGSGVGLCTRFVSVEFTRLEVVFPYARTVLVPAGGSRILANLTLKRNFTEPFTTNKSAGDASHSTCTSLPAADFEQWFWVLPPIPRYDYYGYSFPDFLGFGSELV